MAISKAQNESSSRERIKNIIADSLSVEDSKKIEDHSKLAEDLGADSLDTVELIMKLEEEFGIEIPDEDAEKIQTFGDVVAFIDKKMGEKKGSSGSKSAES